jgi:hypothetical protein
MGIVKVLCPLTVSGGNVDDHPAAGLYHCRQCGPRHAEDAGEIDRQHVVPGLIVNLMEQLAEDDNPGIVNQRGIPSGPVLTVSNSATRACHTRRLSEP